MNWIISANKKIYDHSKAFKDNGFIDWHMKCNVDIGNIIYIYSIAPISAITHICEVVELDILEEDMFDDTEYWNGNKIQKSNRIHRIKLLKELEVPITLELLKKYDLKSAPQGPLCVNHKPKLLKFLTSFINLKNDYNRVLDAFNKYNKEWANGIDSILEDYQKEYPLKTLNKLPLQSYYDIKDSNKDNLCYKLEYGKYAKLSMSLKGIRAHNKWGIYIDKASIGVDSEAIYYDKTQQQISNPEEFYNSFIMNLQNTLIEYNGHKFAYTEKYKNLIGCDSLVLKLYSSYFPNEELICCSKGNLVFVAKQFDIDISKCNTQLEMSSKIGKVLFEKYDFFKTTNITVLGGFVSSYFGEKKPEKYYIISAGEKSKDKNLFFSESIAALGWETGDLSEYNTAAKTNESIITSDMNLKLKNMQIGDIIYLREGLSKIIAKGIVTKKYYYEEGDYPNRVGVLWEDIDIIDLKGKIQLSRFSLIELNKETKEYIDNYKLEESQIMNNKYNMIYFGAPGSSKSYELNELVKDHKHKRVTFHSDYEYSDFVGSIKPVLNEGNMTYEFVPGIFSKLLEDALNAPSEEHYLVIEELTRGNSAAIFGDIFQLLDRDETGASSYPINNTYLEKYLEVEEIKLPNNFYIYATVNNSDQNVYPMDTAFKRRFDFKYFEPIGENYPNFKLFDIEWKTLATKINTFIVEQPHLGEDKQIGAYFIKDGGDDSLRKLLMYLWFDIDKFVANDNERITNSIIKEYAKFIHDDNLEFDKLFSIKFKENFNND